LRHSQFSLTPSFVAMFRELHKDKPASEIDAAICELRKLEGGFVAQAALDDWVSYPDNLGTAGLYANGIHMMGCCPPEGMRGFWEAWQGTVMEKDGGVFVNMAFTRDHAAAKVTAFSPADGGFGIEAKKGGDYFLRAPAWAERKSIELRRGGETASCEWGGPEKAYVVCRNVRAGERLTMRWPVPKFKQVFIPQSVPGRDQSVTVEWLGNSVMNVTPGGRYLPMYGQGIKLKLKGENI
jgi:hypothetical protein